ncbi:MAG: VWA domain-containing protein [Kofleriaceae bacterium]|nr:VWA domain-containing protein [Kofleriaceae bacterium]
MLTPFGLVAGCEAKNVEPGTSTLWASVAIEPRGKALEAERAPLAVALVLDVSGSMQGEPIANVVKSCGLVADLLSDKDQLAIVTFSTHAGVRCGLTTVDAHGREQLRASIAGLGADGSTNLQGGLEVAAGVLMTAAAGLRRVMVVLSDGQPNIGLRSATELAAYVRGLRIAASTLGFGIHHDENVLEAIATAGSGRYAYIPDPVLARVDLARAALAHGGVVADQLELRIAPADGVEVLQVLPATTLRHGKHGIAAPIGDVFVDEGRALAIELRLVLGATAPGRLAELLVEGRAPDGSRHSAQATLDVDIRVGPRVIDADMLRAIILVQADAARAEARAQADRGAMPAAASLLRRIAARIDAVAGFVRNDGSPLAELREQLEDEIANYERKSDAAEYAHQRKASMMYRSASLQSAAAVPDAPAPVNAHLLGIGGPVVGTRHELFAENIIGRASSIGISVNSGNLSRHHARVLFVADTFVLQDLGSTNGSRVNGAVVQTQALADGDLVELGDAVFRFALAKKA